MTLHVVATRCDGEQFGAVLELGDCCLVTYGGTNPLPDPALLPTGYRYVPLAPVETPDAATLPAASGLTPGGTVLVSPGTDGGAGSASAPPSASTVRLPLPYIAGS